MHITWHISLTIHITGDVRLKRVLSFNLRAYSRRHQLQFTHNIFFSVYRLEGNLCDFWETVPDCTVDGIRTEAINSLPEVAPLPVPATPPPPPVQTEVDVEIVSIDTGKYLLSAFSLHVKNPSRKSTLISFVLFV